MIASVAFVATVTASVMASRAHHWFWLVAILACWFLLGGWSGLGWVVAVAYLFTRGRNRVPQSR